VPPKSVTCAVCNQTVLKAQTLARADGSRACRSHEGVQDEAAKLADAERDRMAKALDKGTIFDQLDRERRAESVKYSLMGAAEAAKFREHAYSHCWTCGEEGLEAAEFHMQALVAMKRLEIRDEWNFMSLGPDVRKMMGNIKCLFPIKLQDEVIDKAIVKHIKDHRIRNIVHFLRFVLMCPQCAEKHGFNKRLEEMMPKPTFEQIEAMGPALAIVDPLLKEIAEKKERQS